MWHACKPWWLRIDQSEMTQRWSRARTRSINCVFCVTSYQKSTSWIGDAYAAVRSVWGATWEVSRLRSMDGKFNIKICGRIRCIIRGIMRTIYTQRNDIQVVDGNDVIGDLPGQDVAIVSAQAKVAWTWPSKTDFKTGIELSGRGATELHKPGNKLWRILLNAAVYLHVTRIPALRHWWPRTTGDGTIPRKIWRAVHQSGLPALALTYSHDQNYWRIAEKIMQTTFLSVRNWFVQYLLNYISPEAATDFGRCRIWIYIPQNWFCKKW